MKWLSISDYIEIIFSMILLSLVELLFIGINLVNIIFILIINSLFTYLLLLLRNYIYIIRMKKEAKKKKFIDNEYKKLNDEK